MDILNFKADTKAIDAGEWVDNIPGCGDLRLKVRGDKSTTVEALQAAKFRAVPLSDRDEAMNIKTEVVKRLTRDLLHEAILIGWENLFSGKKEIPYTPEKAKELCTDPAFESFQDAVVLAAQIVTRRHTGKTEAQVKN